MRLVRVDVMHYLKSGGGGDFGNTLRGVVRTVRRGAPSILLITHKTGPPPLQEPRGVCLKGGRQKVSPYFEVAESMFGLGFTQFHGFTSVLNDQPKIS